MKINAFTVNPFAEQTYIIWDEKSREAAVIDPGMISPEEEDAVDNLITRENLHIKYLVNTHMHADHICGNKHIETRYSVGTSAHNADATLGKALQEQLNRFGVFHKAEPVTIQTELKEGDKLQLGDEELIVIETPGHTPGGISLYCPGGKFVVTGDTLFRQSIGRTDLQGGNHNQLVNSIRTKLFTLPDDTLVVPGHDRTSTIGDEKRYNPFI